MDRVHIVSFYMYDKKNNKNYFKHFNYKKTAWYQTIRTENRNYKYRLMFFSFLTALSVVVLLFISQVFENHMIIVYDYFIPFVILLSLFLFLFRWKKVKLMQFFTLIMALAGSFYAVYLPSGGNIYILFFTVFPVLAIQLRGTVKGSLWYAGCALLLLAGYISQRAGILPPWTVDLTLVETTSLIATSFLVYFLSIFAEYRQETLIGRLTDMLVFDDATGLPNKDVLIHSIQPSKPYIFAIIKIENFSNLVALFGYEFSDTISQFASQKLKKYEHRYHYNTYQLKYNEYGILIDLESLPSVAEATLQLNDIVKSIEIESLPWETDKIRLVYRVGGTIVDPEDSRNPLSKADVALKKAERGHTGLSVFENDNAEKENAYDYVIKFTELITNRENDSFRAVFQPVFNNDATGVEWYEALLRIQRQDGTYTSIFPYLNVAKSTGFYQYLTDFILVKSAEAICEYDVDISVNITINDIVRPEFVALVDSVYEQIKEKKGRIIFEILESDELVELDKCIWFIDYIARYGFKIAIDDFGTGYSNYCSLVNLPIDIVKIDGSLIRKIKTDENAKILVEGIVHFCKKSNKKIVAEFVEDKQVFESLKSMNIDFLQGYYLGKPTSISESQSVVSF